MFGIGDVEMINANQQVQPALSVSEPAAPLSFDPGVRGSSEQDRFNAAELVALNADFFGSDLGSLQTYLCELQSRGSEGSHALELLAKELSLVLGTEVTPLMSADNQMSLIWSD